MSRTSIPDFALRPCGLITAAALLLIAALPACAQKNSPAHSASNPSFPVPAAAPDKPVTAHRPAIAQEQALYLVRSALLTLNDANRSGNYTVLRDLAAPDFQARNSAADLALSFADLRQRNFDLFAVALIAPEFTPEPAFDASGKLHMAGSFATRPLRIKFDLTFQNVSGQWRLFALAVATPEAPPMQAQGNRPVQRRLAHPFYHYSILSGAVGWRW
jgi:hypothetical protein